jgi:hypothetical protein
MPVPIKTCGLCGYETKQMWVHFESDHLITLPNPQPCSWETYQQYKKAFLALLKNVHPDMKNKHCFKTREELEESNTEYK